MFYSLTGKIIHKDEQSVALLVGGVGFKCFTTRSTIARINASSNQEETLFTYLNVREDALDLFGFYTNEELDAFKLLLGVSGVGPKAALAILSELTPDNFAVAVASGDTKAITQANGVGPKLAQRIVLELKDKIANVSFISEESSNISSAVSQVSAKSNSQEAIAALTALGYTQTEASVAISKLDQSLSVEDLIKGALKNMTLRF
ncbi:MAG: Holliday junction branch migration protein RuvA [Ruminococcaceae bacterium]|nr:Holliday junction branch migration protein RuvA [Oscillospiraceae bacterium]